MHIGPLAQSISLVLDQTEVKFGLKSYYYYYY